MALRLVELTMWPRVVILCMSMPISWMTRMLMNQKMKNSPIGSSLSYS